MQLGIIPEDLSFYIFYIYEEKYEENIYFPFGFPIGDSSFDVTIICNLWLLRRFYDVKVFSKHQLAVI